jgi:hypothetical protein
MTDAVRRFGVGSFFLLLLAIGLYAYRDYGISWDEPSSRLNGIVTVEYLEGFFRAPPTDGTSPYPQLKDYLDRDYGVLFEAPAVVLERLLRLNDPRAIFQLRHLLTFLVFVCGVYAVYRLAERRFQDWRIGLLAAAFLVLSPRFFAESFYNSKDIVFIAAFAIATNTLAGFLTKPNFATALQLAAATAAAIDVRIMGVLIPVAAIGALSVMMLRREVRPSSYAQLLVFYLAVSAALVIAMWPWLWSSPLGNFATAFTNFAHFRWAGYVRYMGPLVKATELPWHYPIVWLSITTPLLYVGLLVVGLVATVRTVIARRFGLWANVAEMQDVLFLFLFAAPMLSVILMHSVLYDGWRHLYFVYPAFLLIAVKGWRVLVEWLTPIRHGKAAAYAVTLISCGWTALWMWTAHPLENVYFNSLAGHGLKDRYDVDYWGLSTRMALEYILRHDSSALINVVSDRSVPASDTPLRNNLMMLTPAQRHRFRLGTDDSSPLYVVTNYRSGRPESPIHLDRVPGLELFHEITVGGELILSTYKRTTTVAADGNKVTQERH